MAHQEVFTELLHDFREGYTLYGASLFSIWAVPFSDREKIHSEVMDSYIGSVPSSDDSPGDGYALFCKIQDSNTPDTSRSDAQSNLESSEAAAEIKSAAQRNKDLDRIKKAFDTFPDGETKRSIRDSAGINGQRFDRLFSELITSESIEPCQITKSNGQKYDG
jgi:hypothetical protein